MSYHAALGFRRDEVQQGSHKAGFDHHLGELNIYNQTGERW
jgi:hypothetical protein